jgi:large subunit ribosomal protein L2
MFFCKAGGTFCSIIRFNTERSTMVTKLPSNKLYSIPETSYVTLGRNANILIRGIWLGKAGANIKKGYTPIVRGVAKNPVDHPHGGRTKSCSPERTPWGNIAKHNK